MGAAWLALPFSLLAVDGGVAKPLPPECAAAGPSVVAFDRSATADNDRVYFFGRPTLCPGLAPADSPHPANCPWRRKGYIVRGDVVHEHAVSGQFACVTYRTTSGWMFTGALCLHVKPRSSRSAAVEAEARDHVVCRDTRTIPNDAAFFSGTFDSDNAKLKTEFVAPHDVRYQTALADTCKVSFSGLATLTGDVARAADGTTLTFRDGGVDLKLGPTAACPGAEKQFFFDPDPGGPVLVAPTPGSSGCELGEGLPAKPDIIAFHYKLKAALTRNDRATVASLVHYPIVVYGRDKSKHRIRNRADFIANYDVLLSPCTRSGILNNRVGDLFCNDGGVMLAGGAIWILDPTPRITTINPLDCGTDKAGGN